MSSAALSFEPIQSSRRPLELHPVIAGAGFARRPFLVGHRLAGHPLFDLPRLVELASRLPADRVEYNAGDVPLTLEPGKTPRTGLSPEETIRRIETCGSWLVLKNVERDPAYARLLDEALDQVAPFSEHVEPGMTAREAFVFVSSPGAVTPYHMDPEHNFLLQVRGRKRVCLFDGDDRSVLSEVELERFYTGGGRNLVWRDELGPKARAFELEPGRGLYFPVTHPHHVKNGDQVSVSFSVTFRTAHADDRERLHKLNRRIRALGITPSPVGARPAVDAAKLGALALGRRLKRLARARTK